MKREGKVSEFSDATMALFQPSLSGLKTLLSTLLRRPCNPLKFNPVSTSMRPFSLVRVRGLLQAQQQFAVALPEAERMFELNRCFAGIVPVAVARACMVATLQGDVAVIFCANGAAASRVRAQAKGVANVLSRPDAPVGSIKVKIRADWNVPTLAEKKDIPTAGLNAFKQLETALPDGDLKTALERLINRRRRR